MKPNYLIIILIGICFIDYKGSVFLYQKSTVSVLGSNSSVYAIIRDPPCDELLLNGIIRLKEKKMSPGTTMTLSTINVRIRNLIRIHKKSRAFFEKWKTVFLKYKMQEFRKMEALSQSVWDDIQCFPFSEKEIMRYENSWMFERNYGGRRGHEGTDIFPPENVPDYYTVYSMSDGIVEQMGWLPLGGYRIGIRGNSGAYFYYAHLARYNNTIHLGDEITAGTALGTMGDSGYGEEGTTGMFPVHLHVGIYLYTEEAGEISVNPYWVLRYAQQL